MHFFGRLTSIGEDYISIGNNSHIGENCWLTAWHLFEDKAPDIYIGDNADIGACNHITTINKIQIGENLLTGKFVTISDNNHGDTSKETLCIPPLDRLCICKGPGIIGKNVWIGDKATILSGFSIGDGAVIAANAVVTNDSPAYSVAAGIPARIISNVIEKK